MKESDWKLFVKIKDLALEKFCQQCFAQFTQVLDNQNLTIHQRYGEHYDLVRKKNKEMAGLFDGHSRSNAWLQLLGIRSRGLANGQNVSDSYQTASSDKWHIRYTTNNLLLADNTMKLIGVVIILITMIISSELSGGLLIFIDLPAIVIVAGTCFGTILARHGITGFAQITDKNNNKDVLYTLANSAVFAGLIASMLASVNLLSHSEPKYIGPAIAISLISTTYAIAIYAICYALNPKVHIDSGSGMLLLGNILFCGFVYAIGWSLGVAQGVFNNV